MPNAYTPEVRARALEIYRTEGATAAAKVIGAGKQTVSRWAKDAGVECEALSRTTAASKALKHRWELRRAEMIDEIGEVAHLALAKTDEALKADKTRAAKDLATTMAILIDKAQLLDGGATARHDHVDPAAIVAGARAKVVSLVERRQESTGS